MLQAASPPLYSIGEPSDEEQAYLELINRARANPAAEGVRLATTTDPEVLAAYKSFGVNLAMMKSEFEALPVKPPLAFNSALISSARAHSQDMFDKAFQGHTGSSGSTMTSRVNAAGYPWTWIGENVFSYAKSTWYGHAGFQVDWGNDAGGMQTGRGHRANIHGNYREIGIGVKTGYSTYGGTTVGPQIVTQDFGSASGSGAFVTGVTYYDLNGNHFYDPGEGIGGLSVQVSGASYSAVTSVSGGYTVPVAATTANRTVSFTGPGLAFTTSASTPGGINAKADFTPIYTQPVITGPASVDAMQPKRFTFTGVGGAVGYDWQHAALTAFSSDPADNLNEVTPAVTGGYSPLSTSVKYEGVAAYRLAHATAADQTLTYRSGFHVGIGAGIQFRSRLGYASSSQVAQVEVSTDEGRAWSAVYRQQGSDGSGESAFSLRSVSLSAYEGRIIHLRLRYSYSTGTYYPGTGSGLGWFVDGLSFTGISRLIDPVTTSLGAVSAFDFTPPTPGRHLLAVRGRLPGRSLPYGPGLEIQTTPSSTPLPEIAIEQPAGTHLTDNSGQVAFGSQDIGSTSTAKTFTIRNSGTADLNGIVITKAGGNPGDFIVSGPATSTLAPGGNTTFTVAFKPTAAGSRSATLQIASNDADENPFDITLSGSGTIPPAPLLPEIAIEQSAGTNLSDGSGIVDCGNSYVGTAAMAKTFTIRNTGMADLTGIVITKAGGNPGDFIVSGPATSTLAPGGNTTFTVAFKPTAVGGRSATLQIASNDADENPFDISLTGTGTIAPQPLLPEIAVEQPAGTPLSDNGPAILFGNQEIGTTSSAKTFTIRNTGNANLTGIAVTLSGNMGDFIISGPATSTLAPDADTTFTVVFRPTTAGTRSATLRIASNDADENPFDISLTGTGTIAPQPLLPEIAVEQPTGTPLSDNGPAMLFGNQELGTSSAAKTLTIRNTGNANLTDLAVSKNGTNAADFTVNTTGMAASLAPGGSTTFTVTFAPGAAGSRTAALHIASNDADENPFDIQLTGTGLVVDPFTLAMVGTPFEPRVGNQLTLDLTRLANPGETIKLVGKLPTGLKFNPTTGLLTGVLTGNAGSYPLTVQFLQGKTVVRTVSLPLNILPYPATLFGSFEGLLENSEGIPTGVIRFAITKPGAWSATLESAGAKKRSAKGSFLLDQQTDTVTLTANFALSGAAPAESITITLDANSPLFGGTHAGGSLRGFRIAQGLEIPASGAMCNLALDAGAQDGIALPAGIGWLSGKFGKAGSATFKGMLGDATSASVSLRISATGQVLVWAQPYANKQSFLGGIVTLPNLGQSPANSERLETGLWWSKAADAKTLSYPAGFGPLPVAAMSAAWTPPASAITLGSTLGWTDGRAANLLIEGAGLSNAEPQSTALALPTAFMLDDLYNLNATAPQGVTRVPWLGKVAKTDGKWTGTLTLPIGFAPEVLAGKASASGVLLPGADASGCGFIKVPVAGSKGSFRTAAVILGD